MVDNVAKGSKVFIGNSVPCTTLTQFQAQTWVEVGLVGNLGEFGDQSNDSTFTTLAGRVKHYAGAEDGGTLPVTCASNTSDAGQTAMRTAQRNNRLNYNFRVDLNDAETLTGDPTTIYFYGIVLSDRRNVGDANNVVTKSFNVAINSEALEVASN